MGCHTRFSNKLEIQPTYEDLREKYLTHLKNEMAYYERHISGTLKEDELFLFGDKTIERSKYSLGVLNRIYRMVLNRYCQVATVEKCAEVINLDFSRINNCLYKDLNEFLDVFRIGDYPNDELLSMKETLEFFDKNNDKIFWGSSPSFSGKEKIIEILQDFWNKYPNGRVRFG